MSTLAFTSSPPSQSTPFQTSASTNIDTANCIDTANSVAANPSSAAGIQHILTYFEQNQQNVHTMGEGLKKR